MRFEEIDYQDTPIGPVSLRRRTIPKTRGELIYEVKLGEDFLMSSLFTVVEEELARQGLEACREHFGPEEPLDVVVGGLGLGHTAIAALEDPTVQEVIVIELLEPVIQWHERGLVPLGPALMDDERCRVIQADFFDLALDPELGFDPAELGRRFHAVLLDIDHSPENLLRARNESIYQAEGLRKLATRILPGGIFGLWSDDPPHQPFIDWLSQAFAQPQAKEVAFDNPLTDGTSYNTLYLARRPG